MRHVLGILLLSALIASPAATQPAQRVIVGADGVSWSSGGGQRDPTILIKRRGHAVTEDTTNAPGDAIDFDHRPGWISPLHFDADENIAARVLSGEGSINLKGAFYGATSSVQLLGTVNGDHDVAFERKPDIFNTTPPLRDVWVILDFSTPVGIRRVRFYPRNTVVPTPLKPFHEDFLRAYELWVNAELTDLATPDRLVQRDTANESRVVDIELAPQYVRLVKLRSLSTVPYEFDEIEVYGTGYMAQGKYLSDIIDLGDRATIGPLTWVEEALGDPLFSALAVRLRTGVDDTPIRYQKNVRDARGIVTGWTDVTAADYYRLNRSDRAPLSEDTDNWSPWTQVDNGALPEAPVPRRFVQFRLEFDGGLFETRQVDHIGFDFLVPPLADGLTAEINPRLAEAEKPASFRYAVRLEADGDVRGFDQLEVDTNISITAVREATLNGLPYALEVASIREDGFVLRFPLVQEDDDLLEFTFDLPIFRFGTTFSGRASRGGVAAIPQRLAPGNAVDFGPGDVAELSGLFVAIPKTQIGKLVGEILPSSPVFSPNGDGINDRFDIAFNLLQLLAPAPVSFDIFDLGGRRVRHVSTEERGIGPAGYTWDGCRDDGTAVVPGIYVWVLQVSADALKERHTGTVGVAY